MRNQSVVLNPRNLGVLGLVREAARARRVGPTPETVFRLFRPFHGPALDEIYERVLSDPMGKRILAEGRSLQPALLDFDGLRSLPEGTLGKEYLDFMESNQIDIVSFTEASLRHMTRDDYANEGAWTLVNRLRDIHELIHVVAGYGTDELGEMGELAFYIREDPRPAASRFAIRVNIAAFRRRGYSHSEEVIAQAFQRGSEAALLVGADWESMLSWPIQDVRKALNISEPDGYEPIPPSGEAPHPRDLVRAAFTGSRVTSNFARSVPA